MGVCSYLGKAANLNQPWTNCAPEQGLKLRLSFNRQLSENKDYSLYNKYFEGQF